MPGTPVKDGRDLLSKFDAIIKRRLEYNKKNNLPPDTLTKEEQEFRERIGRATPNLNYPFWPQQISKIIQDINQGRNIRPEEIKLYTDPPWNSVIPKTSKESGEEALNNRDELKRMWLGIDKPSEDTDGYWIKSEFKPQDSSNPNAIYYRPKNIPKLTTQEFDELYNEILKTRLPNGKFPGGNSDIIVDNACSWGRYKYITCDLIQRISGDNVESGHLILGSFKFGTSIENGRKYITIYDMWDLVPPSLKRFGVDLQKYGKTLEMYYRIYR
jgi:hypothetical protein